MKKGPSKADLEDKLFRLKDSNKVLKGKQLKLEQSLKRARWEASYFRKKANLTFTGNDNGNDKNSSNAEHRVRMNVTENDQPCNDNIASILLEIRDNIEKQKNVASANPAGRTIDDEQMMNMSQVRQQMAEKQTQIAFLTQKYEALQSNVSADRIIKQRALTQCEKYKAMLLQTEQRNEQLQSQAYNVEALHDENESLKLYVKNLKSENESLKQRIDKLTQNTLLGDELETHRISKMRHTYTAKISELQSALSESMEQVQSVEDMLKRERAEHEKLRQQLKRLRADNEKMRGKTKLFESESGLNVDDLQCALQLIEKWKYHRAGGNHEQFNLSFLDKIEIDKCDDPILLRGKIDELYLKTHDLIVECTQNQNLLEVQINLNKKLEKDYHDLEREYSELKHSNHNLHTEMFRLSQNRNVANLLISENQLFTKHDIDDINYSSTQNLIIFKVTQAELDPNYFDAVVSPLTLLIVEFYEFEPIVSNISGGYTPKYNLFCQYKIKMDRFFLHFLQNESISMDFVHKTAKHKLNIIANHKVCLKHLLITPDACIQNEIQLISNDDKQQHIGKVTFIAKMLRSVDMQNCVDHVSTK